MKIFADTAEVQEIQVLQDLGIIDGVTTNPSLIAKSGRDIREVLVEICSICPGDISGETVSTEAEGMVREGRWLREIADNMVVKVPLTPAGIRACKTLSQDRHPVNVTLCFSANQALLAAKAGARYISPFVGRLDDLGQDGMELIADIREIYDNYGFDTQILTASVRGPQHVLAAAKIGSDVFTAPPKVIFQLFNHPLTDKGLKAFLDDWAKTGQTLGRTDSKRR
ncbi:MAG: fructose-6-phosphate aldolase [Deltaproteobacteria bacterium]|jgi:transaldolase|nr:fructose-6-phosphate aldolase [Deltaproteobacteria bacterium]MDP7158922.1 fructose-6-phosphate aldolase [SAR324 cluster bacterium]MBQ32943.1 fructose-6-phosphate aldolase [Deltaproteobacteria bacterium]MDP7317461.1 fructose-6-phosphate aldolase [SAR324 cluster bacterium]MDP7462860.1 fructose-6-phosphate aldolase [SAR324 cluster bacterium]